MKNKLDDRLKIELIDGKIVNAIDILASIPLIYDYEMLKEYYEFMLQNIDTKEYKELDRILSSIKSRIKSLETNTRIKEELTKIKESNNTFKDVTIIENRREDNDVFRDKYYLKSITDNEITVLEIHNNDSLLYLLVTAGRTMNARDFLILLKGHFRELPTYGMGNNEINILEFENSFKIPDKRNYKAEKEILKKDYPDIVPKVSIDSNHERIYHVDNLVIKFHDEDGIRTKAIIDQKKDLPLANVHEFENNLTEKENPMVIDRRKIEDIQVELNEARLILRNYVRGYSLEENDLLKAYSFLLDTLSKLEKDQEVDEELPLLNAAIDYIREISPNNIEQEILNKYNYHFEGKTQNQNTNKTSYTKKYTNGKVPTSPLIIDNNGVSLTIIVITTTILLGALLATLLLVK